MHYSTRISSRADHYRRQAVVARQRGEQALDQPAVKASFEEVANYWNALAEEVELLELGHSASSRIAAWRGCRMLLGFVALGLAGFSMLIVIGLWGRHSVETQALGFSGIYERYLASQAGFPNDPIAYRAAYASASAWQPVDSRQTVAIEE